MKQIILLTGIFVFSTYVVSAKTVYVNKSGTCTGTPCYTSIQQAVNAAVANDVVFIEAGVYQENVIVTKALTLKGVGQAQTIIFPAVSNFGTVTSLGSQVASSSTVILIRAPNVSVSDLTVDGSNPNISGIETVVNGVTIDARNGIITDPNFLGLYVPYTNMNIFNVTVRNVYMRAIQVASDFGNDNTASIHDCTVQNAAGNSGSIGIAYFYGSGVIQNNNLIQCGITLNWTHDVLINNNTVTNHREGIHTDNSTNTTITDNVVDSRAKNSNGIYVYIPYGKILINKNTIRNCAYGFTAYASYQNTPITFSNNIIDGAYGGFVSSDPTTGIYMTNDIGDYPPLPEIEVNADLNNTVQNVTVGLFSEVTNAMSDANGNVKQTFNGKFINRLNLGNLKFQNIAGYYIKLNRFGSDSHLYNLDATNVLFDNLQNNLADGILIEDKIFHKMDDVASGKPADEGFVMFHKDKVYVTNKDGNNSINRALSAYNKNGIYIGVKDKTPVLEDVMINYDCKIYGNGIFSVRSLNLLTGNSVELYTPALVNKLALMNGYIKNDDNPIILPSDAEVEGGSNASHVTGSIRKTDPNFFSFPIGDGKNYKPIQINSAVSAGSEFDAQYFAADALNKVTPKQIIISLPPQLADIPAKEYWRIVQTKGKEKIQVKFTSTVVLNGMSDNYLSSAYHEGQGWKLLAGSSFIRNGSAVTFNSSITNANGFITWGTRSTALKDIGIYPNPSSSKVNIVHLITNATIRVTTISGQTLSETKGSNVQAVLNAASLPNGNYFIALYDDKGNFLIAKKFMKIN